MADHTGHRERHRERMLSALHKTLHAPTDAELLENVLFTVNPRGDTRPLAEALLAGFGGIEHVTDLPITELCRVKGVGEDTAFLLSLIGELSRRTEHSFSLGPRITDPGCAVDYIRGRLAGLCRDTAFFMCLGGDQRVAKCAALDTPLRPENMNRLGPETVKAHSRSVLLFHAYPDGAPVRDEEEIRAVLRMTELLARPGITLFDFIAFSKDTYISLAQEGLLPPPPYQRQKQQGL